MPGNEYADGPEERLERLASSVRSLQRVVRSATRTADRHRGSDASGLVTMVADNAGQVESVRVDPDWFVRHTSASLGPALFEAYQATMTKVMEATVALMDAAEAEERGRYDDATGGLRAPAGDTGRPQDVHMPTFDDVRDALRTIENRQYEREYQRGRRRTERPEERLVYGPYHVGAVLHRGAGVAEIAVVNAVSRDRISTLEQDTVLALRAPREPDGNADERETGGW